MVYRAHSMDKIELLARALQASDRGLTMIFARTKRTAQRVADDLAERGFAAAPVHGDLGQGAREQALRAFRSGKIDVLVATDVAARGIDVVDVTHVVNYQCPEDAKTYVHRIGRTSRAGRTGVAITLVDWDDMPRWKLISDELRSGWTTRRRPTRPRRTCSPTSGIPTDVTGRLPLASRTRAGLSAEPNDDEHGGRSGRRSRAGRRVPGPQPPAHPRWQVRWRREPSDRPSAEAAAGVGGTAESSADRVRTASRDQSRAGGAGAAGRTRRGGPSPTPRTGRDAPDAQAS